VPILPLTPGARWQKKKKKASCVVVSCFEKPHKTIKIICKYKMALEGF
jgi:hypothetical protein